MLTDQLGQLVAPGCTVCYASRRGSRQWLRTLKVLHVDGGRISGLLHPHGRAVTIVRQSGEDLIVCRGGAL